MQDSIASGLPPRPGVHWRERSRAYTQEVMCAVIGEAVKTRARKKGTWQPQIHIGMYLARGYLYCIICLLSHPRPCRQFEVIFPFLKPFYSVVMLTSPF